MDQLVVESTANDFDTVIFLNLVQLHYWVSLFREKGSHHRSRSHPSYYDRESQEKMGQQ